MSNELFLVTAAVLLCTLVYGMVILVLRAQLHDTSALYREQVADLLARLAARDPSEYRAWAAAPVPLENVFEPRLYDETGLLSVPEEDVGVD